MTTTTHPQAASDLRALIQEAPYVDSFAINPDGGPDIVVEGGSRFVHESDFNAYKMWVTRFARTALDIAALARPAPDATPAGADVEALQKFSEKATLGEWRVCEMENHGTSPSDRWLSYGIEVGEGIPKGVLDTLNSSVAMLDEERDGEGGGVVWDEQGKRDIEFVAALVKAYRSGELVHRTHVLAPPASAADGEGLHAEVAFLLDRLADFENGSDSFTEEGAGDWHGHVRPSIARLTDLLSTTPPPVPPSRVAGLADDRPLAEQAKHHGRDWAVWWQGSGERGDHIMEVAQSGLGYARELTFLGADHHDQAGVLVAEHNEQVRRLREVIARQAAAKALLQKEVADLRSEAEFNRHNAGPSPWPEPWKRCPSTHCERSEECRSPNDCIVRSAPTPGETPGQDAVEALPYGIIDPDYARVFTIARCLAWQEGYALLMHGSFTRDLDMLAVPWTEKAVDAEHLVRRIAFALEELSLLETRPGAPWQGSEKLHGRKAWTFTFKAFGDPRFVDLSVMPRTALASLRSTQADTGGERQAPAPTGDAVEALKPSQMEFERYPKIASAIQEYASFGSFGDWSAFLHDLNSTLADIAQGRGAGQAGLDLTVLHAANIERQAEWCPDQVPDLSFRGNELAGETGEACNVIKKLERERHGWRGSRATLSDLAEELADVVICADLCAVTAGIDLSAAVTAKFNATSDKVGISVRLPAAPATAASEGAK